MKKDEFKLLVFNQTGTALKRNFEIREDLYELRTWLKEKFGKHTENICEMVFLELHGLTEPVRCECGESIKFRNVNVGYGNSLLCRSCAAKKCQQQREETMLKKYGVKFSAQNEESRMKLSQTMLSKYGAECGFQAVEIVQKIKQTNIEKYGSENPFSSTEIQGKIKETLQANYRVNNPAQAEIVKQRISETNFKRYGARTPFESNQIQEKIKQTMLRKYGEPLAVVVSKSMKSRNFDAKLKALEETLDFNFSKDDYIKNTEKYPRFGFTCKSCSTVFIDYFGSGNIPICPTCFPKAGGISKTKIEIFEFVKELDPFVVSQSRQLISPQEIDILSNSHKIAIEVNGDYWHSEKVGKMKTYHQSKSNNVEKLGYQLIHIFENEWKSKQDIVKSRLINLFGKSEKIHARKCELITATTKESKDFFETNHLQGWVPANTYLALKFNDEIVSMMSFGKPRFNKNYDIELLRFCNKLNLTVIGGASKMLKHFVKTNNFNKMISYADRCWSTGKLYERLGFDFLKMTEPGYFFVKGGKRFHRLQLSKKKLSNFPTFNFALNETENAALAGFHKLWDSGQKIFILEKARYYVKDVDKSKF